MKNFRETWREARDSGGDTGELTYRQWGDYRRLHIAHGWWVMPHQWDLGVGFLNDWAYGQSSLHLSIGPLSWALTFHKGKP